MKLHFDPASAEDVQVTKVESRGKKLPDGGEHVIVPQVPEGVGAAYVTTRPHWLGSTETLWVGGQVSVQAANVFDAIADKTMDTARRVLLIIMVREIIVIRGG